MDIGRYFISESAAKGKGLRKYHIYHEMDKSVSTDHQDGHDRLLDRIWTRPLNDRLREALSDMDAAEHRIGPPAAELRLQDFGSWRGWTDPLRRTVLAQFMHDLETWRRAQDAEGQGEGER